MTTALTNGLHRGRRSGGCGGIAGLRWGGLRRWLAGLLPRLVSHRRSMADLADGYEAMARRCIARGDVEGAAVYGECARALRERAGAR